ncbi:membrane protein containing DUF423 [Rhodopirellula maiorica SM1]|uniref:Membrane protein containing DUF423 n=1 Tax=Rhodopirellula maiorica SM1 TaxID=1265738 RepID=M5RII8_9BACT|nr:DUF423 domain-containing protein [Rhodopirellula maiorica]EMI19133.1 membrane protein containing DUF423 [Rhodopirellula maiorica SM1]
MIDTVLQRRTLVAAAICGALAVLIGAFGAHGLPEFLQSRGLDAETIAKRSGQFDVGARYHLVHAVVLLVIAAIPFGSNRVRRVAAWLMLLGILFFSGSLYLLVALNKPWLGAVTPIGGLLWIAGWVSLLGLTRDRSV